MVPVDHCAAAAEASHGRKYSPHTKLVEAHDLHADLLHPIIVDRPASVGHTRCKGHSTYYFVNNPYKI